MISQSLVHGVKRLLMGTNLVGHEAPGSGAARDRLFKVQRTWKVPRVLSKVLIFGRVGTSHRRIQPVQ